MRPIKWKGIRSGLTICCQKISQTNLQCYSCMMKLKIINFWLFFKKRSRDDFPPDSSWFVCLWPRQKCRKTRSDMILVTNPLSESSVGDIESRACVEQLRRHNIRGWGWRQGWKSMFLELGSFIRTDGQIRNIIFFRLPLIRSVHWSIYPITYRIVYRILVW